MTLGVLSRGLWFHLNSGSCDIYSIDTPVTKRKGSTETSGSPAAWGLAHLLAGCLSSFSKPWAPSPGLEKLGVAVFSKGRRSRSLRVTLSYTMRLGLTWTRGYPVLKKIATKTIINRQSKAKTCLAWAWRCRLIVPAFGETEAGWQFSVFVCYDVSSKLNWETQWNLI